MKPKQSQFLFPDHVYIVHQKNDDGDRDLNAFSDPDKAVQFAKQAWKDLLEYVTQEKTPDEVKNMYECDELNEDANWLAGKVPCHVWCSDICWDEVWVEKLFIEH